MRENYKWERWSKLFTPSSVLLCMKEQRRGSCACRGGCFSTVKNLNLFLFSNSSAEPIWGNTSLTFLITLDRDLGDLMLLKLRWEGTALWKSVWKRVKTMIPWGGAERQPLLTLGKISIKAGETQERYSFTWNR